MAQILSNGLVQFADGRILYSDTSLTGQDFMELQALLPSINPVIGRAAMVGFPFVSGGGGAGTPGARGVDGVAGSPGGTGPQGATGIDGLQGQTGPSGGPPGATGVQGQTGPQGQTGVQGDTGQGSQGPQGVTGPGAGAQGATGIQGPTGPSGGPVGATGVQGQTGIQGATGAGTQGQTGVQGATGPGGPLLARAVIDVGTLSINAGSGVTDLPSSTVSFTLTATTLVEFFATIFSNQMSQGQPDSGFSGRTLLRDIGNAITYNLVQHVNSGATSGGGSWTGTIDDGVSGRRLLTLAAGSYSFKLQAVCDSGTAADTLNYTYPLVFTVKDYGAP